MPTFRQTGRVFLIPPTVVQNNSLERFIPSGPGAATRGNLLRGASRFSIRILRRTLVPFLARRTVAKCYALGIELGMFRGRT